MTRLGDVADMLVGFAFKSAGFLNAEADGVPLLRGDNVQQRYIRWGDKTKKWPTSEVDEFERYQLAVDDVILAMDRPIVGDGLKMAWIKPEDLPCLLVQRVCRLRGRSNVALTRFVRYVLAAPAFSEHIHRITTGANIPHISGKDIAAYEFHLPGIDEQAGVVECLSAYDDLIAVNQRRVALLEDAARRLYHEWFVSLQFPGHELVPLRDELPEGWRRMPLGELCDQTPGASVRTGPFGSQLHQSDYKPSGVPVVMPQDIVADRIRHDRIAHVDESTASRLSRHALRAMDIVFPRRGDISKRALVEHHQAGFLCGTGCLKISLPLQPLHPQVLYFQLAAPEMVKWIEGQAVGATMLNLSASIMRSVSCLVPTYSMQKQFVDIVSSLRAQIDALGAQVEALSKARDMLLPKLMSGKLDVSSIRLPEEATA
jgi:type I restriction enzyme S subunit